VRVLICTLEHDKHKTTWVVNCQYSQHPDRPLGLFFLLQCPHSIDRGTNIKKLVALARHLTFRNVLTLWQFSLGINSQNWWGIASPDISILLYWWICSSLTLYDHSTIYMYIYIIFIINIVIFHHEYIHLYSNMLYYFINRKVSNTISHHLII
jgi:hypothetical protein